MKFWTGLATIDCRLSANGETPRQRVACQYKVEVRAPNRHRPVASPRISAGPPTPALKLTYMAFVAPARHLLRARDLADARYTEPLNVDDLAAAARLSRAHFCREFRRTFGVSPYAYLMTRRLERAAALLRNTDGSVAEICLAVGLQGIGSFTTSFKRTFGKTPTEYRASFPPASSQALVPGCIVRAYGRPQHRTIREDSAPVRT